MKKNILILISTILTLVTGMGILSMTKGDIEDIIICSTNSKSHYIPSAICEYYLLNYRLTGEDINFIESGAGLSFLFHISDKSKRYMFLEYFISKGVSIDKPSAIDGLTPLHAAILMNDTELVVYLLDRGANPLKLDRDNKLTAIQFLDLLIKKSPNVNRKNIQDILLTYKDTSIN